MSRLNERLNKLEGNAGELWEPPVIIRWMVNPHDPEAWAVAVVRDGNGMKTLNRRSGETIDRFQARAEHVAERCAAKFGARIGTSTNSAQSAGGSN